WFFLPEQRQRVFVLLAEFSSSHVVSTGVRDCTRLRMDAASETQSVLDRWLTQCCCQSHLTWLKTWSNACATLSAIDIVSICPFQMKHTTLSFFRTRRLG